MKKYKQINMQIQDELKEQFYVQFIRKFWERLEEDKIKGQLSNQLYWELEIQLWEYLEGYET